MATLQGIPAFKPGGSVTFDGQQDIVKLDVGDGCGLGSDGSYFCCKIPVRESVDLKSTLLAYGYLTYVRFVHLGAHAFSKR